MDNLHLQNTFVNNKYIINGIPVYKMIKLLHNVRKFPAKICCRILPCAEICEKTDIIGSGQHNFGKVSRSFEKVSEAFLKEGMEGIATQIINKTPSPVKHHL